MTSLDKINQRRLTLRLQKDIASMIGDFVGHEIPREQITDVINDYLQHITTKGVITSAKVGEFHTTKLLARKVKSRKVSYQWDDGTTSVNRIKKPLRKYRTSYEFYPIGYELSTCSIEWQPVTPVNYIDLIFKVGENS